MTEVNVSLTVGMSATVGGNDRNSGEIDYVRENLRVEIWSLVTLL